MQNSGKEVITVGLLVQIVARKGIFYSKSQCSTRGWKLV